MASLGFGLIAALLWGLHDYVLRNVSGAARASALMVVVLGIGSALLTPISLLPDWGAQSAVAWQLALGSGLAFALGSVGLYRAFAIGPVWLVAPICGAFPVASLGFVPWQGGQVAFGDWLAVAAVILGVALVARQTEDVAQGNRAPAIAWSVLAAAGFALTFGLGQMAARVGAELPSLLIGRITALICVALWFLIERAPLRPALRHWRWLLLMAVLDVSAISLVILSANLPNPEYAAVSASIFGIFTILMAWRFLGESLRPVQVAGLAVVFAGIAMLAAG